MESTARIKNVRMSPQKVRLVADAVRGKNVQRALDDLRFSDKKMAPVMSKLIRSAVNNASQQRGVDVDKLVVTKVYVDQAPTMKRFRTRARGGASRILKRLSHLTVVVGEKEN